ncbi:phosphoglycerol transferase I [Jinshanibacter sp. LJY008]|uniref:Phosphoglycerol transferase I n=1 Tax=Limnobaculum eriocheiris TaxID=2897391 RepID=A0A9X1MWS9_9GAMM|nr:phosphoglycerol transferase I [Limnobaculum eriocheiris]MCD1126040.1 phosphoglycerol transferase I [Limnobaculum eriocheiris]
MFIIIFLLILLTYSSRQFLFTKTILSSIIILLFGFWFVCNMFTGRGITDAIYYHLLNTIKGSSIDDIFWKIIASILFLFLIITIFTISIIVKNRLVKKRKSVDLLFLIILILTLIYSKPLTNLYNSISNLFYKDDNYASKFYHTSSVENNKYNYVFIYAESLERTFRNINGFNYTPNISKLAESYIDFTNIIQSDGGGWTMAGLVNTQCGIPLSLPQGNSANNMSSFLDGAKCIAQYFNENGYKNIFIRGSEKEFAGGDKFLSQHGWDEIHDKSYFLENNLADNSNISGWGIEDDILLAHSYNQFEKLSQKNEKFLLSLLTVNTHPPSGKVLEPCLEYIPKKMNNNILSSVYCSDILIGEFVNKIIKSPYFENTIIVIVSDHLMMPNDADEQLNSHEKDRRNNFIIIKKGMNNIKINKVGTLMDTWPTILGLSNNKNNEMGFGSNLFIKENSALISYYLKNDNINPFIAFSSSLWNSPSLFDSISSDGNTVKIANKIYNLPLYASVSDDNKLKDIYFDSFAIDALNLARNNKKIVFITQCHVVDGKSDGTCLYIITGNSVIKKIINENEVTSVHQSDFISPIYTSNLVGFSSGVYSKNTGTSINKTDKQIKRGITFFGYNTSYLNDYASINIDTCTGEKVNIDVIHKFLSEYKNIIFASNDSFVCDETTGLNEIASIIGTNKLEHIIFRQQLGGVLDKESTQNTLIIGDPMKQLDFFVNLENNKLYSLCSILNDCS